MIYNTCAVPAFKIAYRVNVTAQARFMIYNTSAAWAPKIEYNPNLVANIPLMIYSISAARPQIRLMI